MQSKSSRNRIIATQIGRPTRSGMATERAANGTNCGFSGFDAPNPGQRPTLGAAMQRRRQAALRGCGAHCRLADAHAAMRRQAAPRAVALALAVALAPSSGAAQAPPAVEEIIVTAEKRAESLQDLSQAVAALSEEDIDIRGLATFTDLGSIAPGVTVAKNEGFKTVISIRGVGNEANQNAIANPSVSYHLDGIYVASPFALHTDFLDVERIEVLRGPQGTLFGQNSTGGAINLVTQAPEIGALYGRADLTLGSYNLVQARASANIPLGDALALRASFASRRHDGFSENIVLDQALDQADDLSARVRLFWSPTERLRLHLGAQFHRQDTNGAAQKGILDPTPSKRELAQDSPNKFDLKNQLYSLVAEWDLPGFTAKSLTSYQDDDIAVIRDNDRNDLASLPPFALVPSIFNPETNRQKTFTQEINLISAEPLWGRLEWVAGAFFLDTEVDILIREYLDFGFDGAFDPVTRQQVLRFGRGDYGFISDSNPERDSLSLYGQGTLRLTDRLRLVGGLRYTKDEVYSEVTNFFGRAGTEFLETASRKVTGRAALECDLGEDAMLYGSYTLGFKPGGSNLTFGREDAIAPIVVLPTFKEETVKALEIGIKTHLANDRVRLNAAGFYYDYDNLQYQATDPEVFEGGVGNVPRSEILGAELELAAYLTGKIALDARLAWLDTRVAASHLALDNVRSDQATNALLAQGFDLFGPEIQRTRAAAIRDVKGNRLAKTPSFTANLMLRYMERLGDWGDFTGSLEYSRRGSFQHRIFNNPSTDRVPAYDLLNLTLSFAPSAASWQLDLMAMNLTDKDGVNARFTDVFGVGATGEELIAPRQFMVRAGLEF